MSGVRPGELAAVDLLSRLPAEILEEVAREARIRRFAAGEVIFREGDTGSSLHLVRRGRVRLERTQGDSVLVLEMCDPGEHFGMLAVLDPAPRSATAVVVEDAETIEVDKDDLDRCLTRDPLAAYRMLGPLARSLTMEKEIRTRELYESRLEAIYTLALAAELDDPDTGQHIKRMAQYCARLGRALGMSRLETDELLAAAMLHDVGKFGISDDIIKKAGPLEPHEYDEMKRHPLVAQQLLSDKESALLRLGAQIALAHHERWDGKGYPRGLKFEQIPLEGRICALCDVFDALTSRRPYKEPWPIEKAMEEIERLAGAAFDPALVDSFVSILPEIEEIKDRFSE